MEITCAISDCRFGRLLVAATDRGLCMVTPGSSDLELENRLRASFPTVTINRDDAAMNEMLHHVTERIAGRGTDSEIPLDLHGTPFQLAVWRDMLTIPAGSTRSYAEVARNIGRPTAFRAVAQACGANPVPIVVPCHRVVASGGGLGGYTGGIDRKIALLAAEGVQRA